MERKQPAYRRSDNVVFRQVLDEHILIPIRGQVADMQRVFVLNAVGAFIWDALETAPDAMAIVSRVVREFEVEARAAEADVQAFLEELTREELIASAAT